MDALGLYDIYGYHHQPFWQTISFKIGIVIAALVLVFLVVFCVVFVMRKRTTINDWNLWFGTLDTLERQKLSDMRFYAALSEVVKESAALRLHAPKSLTDLELALLLKTHTHTVAHSLGEVMERAAVYKYDPLHAEHAKQKKELELVRDALRGIQQMEQKQ
jgi:hypothetical protein